MAYHCKTCHKKSETGDGFYASKKTLCILCQKAAQSKGVREKATVFESVEEFKEKHYAYVTTYKKRFMPIKDYNFKTTKDYEDAKAYVAEHAKATESECKKRPEARERDNAQRREAYQKKKKLSSE